jgi:hypothetical protein
LKPLHYFNVTFSFVDAVYHYYYSATKIMYITCSIFTKIVAKLSLMM